MKLRLRDTQALTATISTFQFEPLDPCEWLPGQSIRLELATRYGQDERRFTISSSPKEQQLTVTTRRSPSLFKEALFALTPGTVIDGYAIEGDFVWQPPLAMPHLFIAIGLGITPFRAMCADQAAAKLPLSAELLHAAPTNEELFQTDFEAWTGMGLRYTFIPAVRLSASAIAQRTTLTDRHIYLAGPSTAVRQLYDQLSPDIPSGHLHLDWFTGYGDQA